MAAAAYGGGTRKIERDFKGFEEGIKERKLVLKHHQTVEPTQEKPRLVEDYFQKNKTFMTP